MASAKVATKKASKSMPSKKEEGTVWVSPDGILYTEPKIDADLLKKSRENKYIVEGLGKQRRLIFRKGLKVELIDKDNDDKADEKESKFLMTMVRKPDVALHNKIQLLWEDAMEFGCGPYNDAWADTDEGYVMTKLNRLPPETFENGGASVALVYNRILQGIRWNHETKKTEYWQTQADGSIVQLSNVGLIVDPLCGEIGGTPYIIPLVPFVNMLRFLWNKKMQEANIFGAGGLYFIKVKNPQGDDTEFAQKILNNESGDVRFQLRENMDLVVITVSGTGVAIEGIQEAQSQVQTFFTASNLIQKDGTLIGGSSQPEFDLFMAYLESTHRWLEEAVRIMLLPYLKGNGFASNWDIKVTIPDLEYDKSQTLLSAVSSAYTTKSITLAERRKVYEKVGIDTKDMTPAEEKALLAEYEANNPAPVMSPMLQKVEAMAKVISATPLDPHAFIHQGKMEEAIDALDGEGKKGLPFLPSQPTKNDSQQSRKLSLMHGGEGSGRYPKGSGDVKSPSSMKPLSLKTLNMDQNTQPHSTLEKQSREIIKSMPAREEWVNPRGREIAELAAMAHGTGMTTDIATNDTDGFEGIIAHYNDADGVNITYLASVGKTKGVGSDLLKKVINANEGKDINLFADPGAVTYYQHIGMEQLSGDETKGGVFRWAAKDAKAFADKGTEKINKIIDDVFEHGGPGSGRYPAGSGDNGASSSSLAEKYGGMPEGGGFGSATEYEVGHQRYAEAAHCILGSLHRAENDADDPTNYQVGIDLEIGHITEELGIMQESIDEYSKPLYNEQMKRYLKDPESRPYVEKAVDSIQKNGKELSTIASEKMKNLSGIKNDDVRHLAKASYVALKTIGDKSQQVTIDNVWTFNVFNDRDVIKATRDVKDMVTLLYPKARLHGGPGSGRYPKGSGDNEVSPDIPAAKDSLKFERGSSAIFSSTKTTEQIRDEWGQVSGLYKVDLTEDDKDAVRMYTQAGYGPINSYARHGVIDSSVDFDYDIKDESTAQHYVELMDNAIEHGKQQIPPGVEIWRGIGEHSGQATAALEIGDICEDAGFQSFSMDPYTGGNFARVYEMPKTSEDKNLSAPLAKTVIRAISTGTSEKALGGSMTERELIFPRGTKWQVVSKEQFDVGQGIKLNVVTVMHHE